MAKAKVIGDKTFRIRRGKLVEVPAEWVGKIPHDQTMRKRPSNMTNKLKRELKRPSKSMYGLKFVDHDPEKERS